MKDQGFSFFFGGLDVNLDVRMGAQPCGFEGGRFWWLDVRKCPFSAADHFRIIE